MQICIHVFCQGRMWRKNIYSQESPQAASEDTGAGESIQEVAKKCGIPKSTLCDHKLEKHVWSTSQQRHHCWRGGDPGELHHLDGRP